MRGKQFCCWFVWDIHTTRGGPSTGGVGEGKTVLWLVCVGHTTRSGPSTGSVGGNGISFIGTCTYLVDRKS